MRGWIALLAFAIVATIVAAAISINATRDTVPEQVRACAADGGAQLVRSSETLGALRRDVEARRTRLGRMFPVGEDRAVVIQGLDYRVLVLAGDESAPLDADVARRTFLDPSKYIVVAVERDPTRVVETCARRADD